MTSNTAMPEARPPASVTLTDMVRYQGASGDFNPLHHDADFARAGGFDRPVVVGMYMAGLMSTWLADRQRPESVRRFGVRFLQPAFIGDVLQVGGETTEIRDAGERVETDVTLWCRRVDDGVELVRGWATCVAPKEEAV